MKKLVIPFFIFLVNYAYGFQTVKSPPQAQEKAVKNLIERLIGKQQATRFHVTITNSFSANDSFSMTRDNDHISIIGSTGVAAAYGFNYYLKYFCNCHVSWDGDQLKLPTILPDVNVTKKSFDRFRYYQNVCTSSYSFAWWNWTRWEREIDWMALNGINLALAFTAQEAVWIQIYKTYNMTDDEIQEHLSGPAFFAWQRMGNIRGWGGPLRFEWYYSQIPLQKKIVNRMRELGINPVLPAFCGHVPKAFKRLYPEAEMKVIPAWCNFPQKYCCPYMLSPRERLFTELGTLFVQELVKLFGPVYFYNCDTFNELENPFEEKVQLKEFSATVFNAIQQAEPRATYILQGWLFWYQQHFWTDDRVRDYLSGVSNDRMIILDLYSEINPLYVRLQSYFGKPFIWCMLHNFGGTLGMHGSIDVLNERVVEARNMMNSTMIGTGLTPEGINQNYVVYDFMLESSWRNETLDTDSWFESFSNRRYGIENADLKQAWKLLKNSVYNLKGKEGPNGQYIVSSRPSLKHKPEYWYNISDVAEAWDLFVNASKTFRGNDNFKHDLVDLSRQFFQILFDQLYLDLVRNYKRKDIASFEKSSAFLLEALNDLDALLSSNTHFMVGPWIKSAILAATSEQEKSLFEANAKNQITIWGPKGEILDYATKQWSGVVSDYYYPRWQLFRDGLFICLTTGAKFQQETYNDVVFRKVEEPFYITSKPYPTEPVADTLGIVNILYEKWRKVLCRKWILKIVLNVP